MSPPQGENQGLILFLEPTLSGSFFFCVDVFFVMGHAVQCYGIESEGFRSSRARLFRL